MDTPLKPSTPQPEAASKPPKEHKLRTPLIVAVLSLLIVAITWVVLDQRLSQIASDDFAPTEVAITADGFEPSTILVPVGAEVRWVNRDNEPHWIASDPFPEADGLAELNSGEAFGPDSEYSFTFTEAGEYGYHDTLNPETTGMVIVVEE